MSANGKVVQIIGPVMDVEFPEGEVPEIMSALTIDEEIEGNRIKITAEVQQHIGRNQVRAVAMSSTDGLIRGVPVVNTGAPISVPVGEEVLGRILQASRAMGNDPECKIFEDFVIHPVYKCGISWNG